MSSFDVIVVGAGPAGASAAEACASRGLSTLLLECESLPRPKLCAGVVPPRIFHLVRDVPEEVVERGFRGYHVVSPSGVVARSEFHRPGLIVDRSKFDLFLTNKAKDAGAVVVEGRPVADVQVGDGILVSAGGESFSSRFLVAADGVDSLVRRRLGLPSPAGDDLALGVQYEVKLSEREVSERLEDFFEVHYTGVVDCGYGWLSPLRDSVKVGLGGSSEAFKQDPRKFLDDFMSHSLVRGKVAGGRVVSFGAHRIPLCGPLRQLARGPVLFAGDAGGFVWPLTGEGIYPAVGSGRVAGEAVAASGGGCLGALYGKLLGKRGLLCIRRQAPDRGILSDADSMESYVRALSRRSR